MQLGAHDMPAAEGLGRSAECGSIPHCSLLLTACFPSLSLQLTWGGQNQISYSCQTSITCSPLPTVNCEQVTITCYDFYCLKNSSKYFWKNTSCKHYKWYFNKISFGLEITEGTLLPLFALEWQNGAAVHAAVWLYQKGCVPALTHLPLSLLHNK